MKNLAILLTVVGIAQSSFAALPAYYERTRVIKAVMDDPALHQRITGPQLTHASGVIDGVARTGSAGNLDYFQVASGACATSVVVESLPNPNHMVGPPPLRVSVGQSVCR